MLRICALLLALVGPSVATFGGCCGGYMPPPCPLPPMPICAPPAPPCPPPPICPPQFCPPPPICPPPPPPPPPPMCPMLPPPPPPSPCMSYAPQPVFSQYVAQPSNDCCCRCGNPCRFRARHRMHGSKTFSSDFSEEEIDPTCSSRKLKKILLDNMTSDPSESKRQVQQAAEDKLSGKFNVICAKGDFSYVAYTESYCQAANDDVTCYAFRPM